MGVSGSRQDCQWLLAAPDQGCSHHLRQSYLLTALGLLSDGSGHLTMARSSLRQGNMSFQRSSLQAGTAGSGERRHISTSETI